MHIDPPHYVQRPGDVPVQMKTTIVRAALGCLLQRTVSALCCWPSTNVTTARNRLLSDLRVARCPHGSVTGKGILHHANRERRSGYVDCIGCAKVRTRAASSCDWDSLPEPPLPARKSAQLSVETASCSALLCLSRLFDGLGAARKPWFVKTSRRWTPSFWATLGASFLDPTYPATGARSWRILDPVVGVWPDPSSCVCVGVQRAPASASP